MSAHKAREGNSINLNGMEKKLRENTHTYTSERTAVPPANCMYEIHRTFLIVGSRP